MKNKNNNAIRAKKFKVGSLYRNDTHPRSIYLCIGDCDFGIKSEKKYSRKGLVVVKDGSALLGEYDCCEGHIVTADAVKNWNWHEI